MLKQGPSLPHKSVFGVHLVFSMLLFGVFGVFCCDFWYWHRHPQSDSPSFLNYFSECWLVGPLQLSFPTLDQTSSYVTA